MEVFFFLTQGLRGWTQQERNGSEALWNHTSPHANLLHLNKRQELALHTTRSLIGLVSNRRVFFFSDEGHYID